MARTGYACLWVLLVLATFAQCGLGSGTVHVYNGADADIILESTMYFVNGNTETTDIFHLAKGTAVTYNVTDNTNCVKTGYLLTTPSAQYAQFISDWCTQDMLVPCLPNCFWIINNNGFSVADSAHSVPQFVTVWNEQD